MRRNRSWEKQSALQRRGQTVRGGDSAVHDIVHVPGFVLFGHGGTRHFEHKLHRASGTRHILLPFRKKKAHHLCSLREKERKHAHAPQKNAFFPQKKQWPKNPKGDLSLDGAVELDGCEIFLEVQHATMQRPLSKCTLLQTRRQVGIASHPAVQDQPRGHRT